MNRGKKYNCRVLETKSTESLERMISDVREAVNYYGITSARDVTLNQDGEYYWAEIKLLD